MQSWYDILQLYNRFQTLGSDITDLVEWFVIQNKSLMLQAHCLNFTTDPVISCAIWTQRRQKVKEGKVGPMLINKQHAMKMYGGVEV
jgi:hypothetical protein